MIRLAPYLLSSLLLLPSPILASVPICLWVSSYHEGYEWEDGIGKGLKQGLDGKCQLEIFRMDTKRNTDKGFIESQAKAVNKRIQELNPDVVILSDDNASRYVAVPYLKATTIPLVFVGINWDVSKYGYPWDNATGMVEVAPVLPLLKEIRQVVDKPRRGLYLSSNVFTERVDAEYYVKAFARNEIDVEVHLVDTMQQWIDGYRYGQEFDFIVLGNYAGITDWSAESAAKAAYDLVGKITVTNYDWMMQFAMVGKTKIPDEHGEWAAQLAEEILSGTKPGDIPIVSNRRWSAYINPKLLDKAGIELNRDSIFNAIRVD